MEDDNGLSKRPDVIDWGTVGENAALRAINTGDPVDMDRYWVTNKSVGPGLMVDDIDTPEELVEAAKFNGKSFGFTFAISATSGKEVGEFQGFVQFTVDTRDELRRKIEQTGLFCFLENIDMYEVSYAKYPNAAPRQVASAVRQGCIYLLRKLRNHGYYPRLAIVGSTSPLDNPESIRVLANACFDPIGTCRDKPEGIIKYEDQSSTLDAVWLLNWQTLHHKLREKANREFESNFRAI